MKNLSPLFSLCLLGACYDRVDVVARDASAIESADASDAVDGGACGANVPTLLGTSQVPIRADGCVSAPPPSHTESTGTKIDCTVIETSSSGATVACDAARGRHRYGERDCFVDQLPLPVGATAPTAGHGFFARLGAAACSAEIRFTSGDEPQAGMQTILECARRQTPEHPITPATCRAPIGAQCHPTRPDGSASCTPGSTGCFLGTERYLEANNPECALGACLVDRYAEPSDPTGARAADRVHCSCRCAGLAGVTDGLDPSSLCACPSGFSCEPVAGPTYGAAAGSYCVRVR